MLPPFQEPDLSDRAPQPVLHARELHRDLLGCQLSPALAGAFTMGESAWARAKQRRGCLDGVGAGERGCDQFLGLLDPSPASLDMLTSLRS